jgi:hypothetical protein
MQGTRPVVDRVILRTRWDALWAHERRAVAVAPGRIRRSGVPARILQFALDARLARESFCVAFDVPHARNLQRQAQPRVQDPTPKINVGLFGVAFRVRVEANGLIRHQQRVVHHPKCA